MSSAPCFWTRPMAATSPKSSKHPEPSCPCSKAGSSLCSWSCFSAAVRAFSLPLPSPPLPSQSLGLSEAPPSGAMFLLHKWNVRSIPCGQSWTVLRVVFQRAGCCPRHTLPDTLSSQPRACREFAQRGVPPIQGSTGKCFGNPISSRAMAAASRVSAPCVAPTGPRTARGKHLPAQP